MAAPTEHESSRSRVLGVIQQSLQENDDQLNSSISPNQSLESSNDHLEEQDNHLVPVEEQESKPAASESRESLDHSKSPHSAASETQGFTSPAPPGCSLFNQLYTTPAGCDSVDGWQRAKDMGSIAVRSYVSNCAAHQSSAPVFAAPNNGQVLQQIQQSIRNLETELKALQHFTHPRFEILELNDPSLADQFHSSQNRSGDSSNAGVPKIPESYGRMRASQPFNYDPNHPALIFATPPRRHSLRRIPSETELVKLTSLEFEGLINRLDTVLRRQEIAMDILANAQSSAKDKTVSSNRGKKAEHIKSADTEPQPAKSHAPEAPSKTQIETKIETPSDDMEHNYEAVHIRTLQGNRSDIHCPSQ